MEFGIEKCAMLVMKSGKRHMTDGMELGSWWTGRDYPNDSIAEDGQNTGTSSGDLRRLAVTQTPVKNHQLILMWKTLEE